MQTISAEHRLEFYLSSSRTAASHTVQLYSSYALQMCSMLTDVLLQMNFYRCQISVSIFYTFCLSSLRERCMTGTSVRCKVLYCNFLTLWTSSNFGQDRWCRMSDECVWTYVFVISTSDSEALSITEWTQIISVFKDLWFYFRLWRSSVYFHFWFMLYLWCYK